MAIAFAEARDLILENVRPLGTEQVHLLAAAGRVLSAEIRAPWDMPAWDNSAMDGFAVRCADCAPAPVQLTITGYLPAGGTADGLTVAPGTAVKIMTGAPIPAGCDAVVPFEETEEKDGRIRLLQAVAPHSHIRFRGEDVRSGDPVLTSGAVLRPPEINLLATFGQAIVPVFRRPRVAILSTGDELVELGERIGPGQIVNSNALSLAAAVQDSGGEPVLLGIARDNPQSLSEKLEEGLQADALITSAGVSAGDRDLVREVLAKLGVREVFWKIEIKPGRPTAFGLREGKPVFSLPGNPVSTMVTFETLVRPALLKMQGRPECIRPSVKAVLKEPAKKKKGRVHFLRVQVTSAAGALHASSSGDQNTGILRTMVRANGIAVLPAEREAIAAGEEVEILLFDSTGLF